MLAKDVWREAAVAFYAERAALLRRGKRAPKGVQGHLNRTIDDRMKAAGWDGGEGRYLKGSTWIRVTFRHQMSIGSDILDAMRLQAREGLSHVAILAADAKFLRVISPNDAAALVSFEKLRVAIAELGGVIRTQLFVGALSPLSELPSDIAEELGKVRLRDTSVPVDL